MSFPVLHNSYRDQMCALTQRTAAYSVLAIASLVRPAPAVMVSFNSLFQGPATAAKKCPSSSAPINVSNQGASWLKAHDLLIVLQR